jgi:hypothetical protein
MLAHATAVYANIMKKAQEKASLMNAAAKTSDPWPTTPPDRHEAIRRRAEEIYIRNGRVSGRDVENWAQAEQEILQESAPSRRTAIIVKVNGTEYVGEYNRASSGGYLPGEFGPGASVPVRFHGDHMFVKRPNGKILETTIVERIG